MYVYCKIIKNSELLIATNIFPNLLNKTYTILNIHFHRSPNLTALRNSFANPITLRSCQWCLEITPNIQIPIHTQTLAEVTQCGISSRAHMLCVWMCIWHYLNYSHSRTCGTSCSSNEGHNQTNQPLSGITAPHTEDGLGYMAEHRSSEIQNLRAKQMDNIRRGGDAQKSVGTPLCFECAHTCFIHERHTRNNE